MSTWVDLGDGTYGKGFNTAGYSALASPNRARVWEVWAAFSLTKGVILEPFWRYGMNIRLVDGSAPKNKQATHSVCFEMD